MKVSIFLRYVGLLLVGLMAGNSFSFLDGMGTDRLSVDSYAGVNRTFWLPFFSWIYFLYLMFIVVVCANLFFIRSQWKTLEFILVVFSLVCVVDDLVMTVVVGGLQWQARAPENWSEVHSQLLNFTYIRSALLISSFILLLASTYFMRKPNVSRKGAFAVV